MPSYSLAPGKIAFWSNNIDGNAVTDTELLNLTVVTAGTISNQINKN